MLFFSCTENAADNTNDSGGSVSQLLADTLMIQPEEDAGSLSELFTYHNKLVISPDMDVHVLGTGGSDKGNYLILKSDKSRSNYVSITGDRQGHIITSSVTDMDADHQIEVIIFTRSEKDSRGSLIIHEIDSLNNHTRIALPELASDLSQGYEGQDTLFVASNKIIREFPVFPKAGSGTKASTGRRHIEYVLKSNSLLPSNHHTQ
jgi:hypothetical protein